VRGIGSKNIFDDRRTEYQDRISPLVLFGCSSDNYSNRIGMVGDLKATISQIRRYPNQTLYRKFLIIIDLFLQLIL
jgi:hypothetical protein